MDSFPYIFSGKKLKKIFSLIQKVGIPKKVNPIYLQQLGFKSNNDLRLIPLLKSIGFIDSTGIPTKAWKIYRDLSKSKKVLATGVKKAYSTLFFDYPDANRKDNEALRTYFSASSDVGKDALDLIVRTFKTLCDLSDFESAPLEVTEEKITEPSKAALEEYVKTAKGLTLNINIQLQLPATDDVSIYDKLFSSMKKHLLSD